MFFRQHVSTLNCEKSQNCEIKRHKEITFHTSILSASNRNEVGSYHAKKKKKNTFKKVP